MPVAILLPDLLMQPSQQLPLPFWRRLTYEEHERSGSLAVGATNGSPPITKEAAIFEHTQARNPLLARNVAGASPTKVISRNTRWFILKPDLSLVPFVAKGSLVERIFGYICERILQTLHHRWP